eukprot:SAG11_NODE_5744_length_1473_cov_1.846434_1_plen_95_part_10
MLRHLTTPVGLHSRFPTEADGGDHAQGWQLYTNSTIFRGYLSPVLRAAKAVAGAWVPGLAHPAQRYSSAGLHHFPRAAHHISTMVLPIWLLMIRM